jgi:hypothetical protein
LGITIRHIILFVFVACGMMTACTSNRLPDLNETYRYKDTKAFGGYIAYHLLQNSYPDQAIQLRKTSFTNTAAWISDTASLYVNISRKFYVNDDDAIALMDYVYKGNTAFIAAAEIDTALLGRLYIKQDSLNRFFDEIAGLKDTKVQLVPAVVSENDSIKEYYYRPFSNYFSELNDRYCRVVGYNEFHRANFITFFWGKGRFYLHCDPRSFSNYFLLQKSNYHYMEQLLQALPEKPEHIYWDDHYNKVNLASQKERNKNGDGNDGDGSSFWDAVFSNPALTAAFWIVLLLMMLYILFNIKRRQRAIPVIKPVQNSSVKFAEAIAGVYLKEKNNKTIAEKMINYFNESVRSRYYLNTNVINKEFLTALSKKAAVPLKTTEFLYRTIQQVGNTDHTSDQLLLDLNDQIQQFNKYNS